MITAEEWQLLSFFEVVPTTLDENVPWPYNDFVYQLAQGKLSLSCAIAPANQDVRIVLKQADSILYELNSVGVDDVQYLKHNNTEILAIDISTSDRVLLRVKPSFKVTHESNSET